MLHVVSWDARPAALAAAAHLGPDYLITRAAGVELWPHAKTHRMAQAGQHEIAHGASGLCVAKRMSEEHGWLRWHGSGEPPALPVGTRLEIVPNHICMAFAMLRRASIVRGGNIIDVWDGFGPGASE